MPRDDYWRFELGNEPESLPVSGHEGSIENQTYASGYSLIVWLTGESDSPAGVWPDYRERYQTLDAMQDFAGKFALHELSTGRVAYSETHTGSQSNLIGLRPPAGVRDSLGGWYLLAGVSDMTTLPEALCELELELVFAAPLGEYSDHAAARAGLESPI